MTDPYIEASKYHRACIREHDRYRRVLDREKETHEIRLLELRKTLSPAAARIVAVAEQTTPEAQGGCSTDVECRESPASSGTISPRLMQPVPELPAGAIVAVDDKPKKAGSRG